MKQSEPDVDIPMLPNRQRSTLMSVLRLLVGTVALVSMCVLVSAPRVLVELPRACLARLFA